MAQAHEGGYGGTNPYRPPAKNQYYDNKPTTKKALPSFTSVGSNMYKVQSGDTLSAIANKYGMSYQDLAKYNNIGNPNLINIGQTIRIPGSGGTSTPTTSAPAPTTSAPRPTTSAPAPSSNTGAGTNAFDMDYLRKQFDNIQVGGSPDLPAPINMDDYAWQDATINDLQQKYGFDYSRDYAARIAEAQAQAKRDAIATQRQGVENEKASAKDDLKHDFFQQFLELQQASTNQGLNSGLAEDRNTRLEMNRQNALGDILAQAQLRNSELGRDEARIEQERIAQEDQLFNERLAQAFEQIQKLDNRSQLDAMQRLQQAVRLREQNVDEAYKNWENNSMSVSDYEKFLQDVREFGMDIALRRHQGDAKLEFEAGYRG